MKEDQMLHNDPHQPIENNEISAHGLDDLLTVQDVAHILRVPVSWVYERTRTRAIPMRKLGRHIRVPRAELLAWIDAQDTANKRAGDE
jgi:excisionase family DNA binding protein